MPGSPIRRGCGRPSRRRNRRACTASKPRDPPRRRPWRHSPRRRPLDCRTAARSLDRPAAVDPPVAGQRHRAAREDVLGSSGGRGSPNGGGQLVGNLAGGLDQWCGAERSRHAAPRARRPARRGDRARVAVPDASGAVARTARRRRALASTAMDRIRVSDSTRAILRRSADLDALTLVLTTAVSTERDDLVAVYLPGLDIAQRALAGDPGPGTGGPWRRITKCSTRWWPRRPGRGRARRS